MNKAGTGLVNQGFLLRKLRFRGDGILNENASSSRRGHSQYIVLPICSLLETFSQEHKKIYIMEYFTWIYLQASIITLEQSKHSAFVQVVLPCCAQQIKTIRLMPVDKICSHMHIPSPRAFPSTLKFYGCLYKFPSLAISPLLQFDQEVCPNPTLCKISPDADSSMFGTHVDQSNVTKEGSHGLSVELRKLLGPQNSVSCIISLAKG